MRTYNSDSTLHISFQKDPVTLDPQKSGDPTSSALIFLLFKGLTRLEPDHGISCDLASSFHILNDSKKYVFFLGNHSWSDGTPVTAHDFVYSWKRALSPDFPLKATNLFFHIKNAEKAKKGLCSLDKVGVYAKDDTTLVVELEYPCPYFLELTSFCPLFPVSSKAKDEEIFSISSNDFGLQKWSYGSEILLKRHNYSEKYIDSIHVKIVPDEKEAFTLYENNELDWIGDPVSPLPSNFLPALVSAKKIKSQEGLVSCWFNTLKHPFSNADLRKAIASVIPRQNLLEKLLLSNTLSATRFCPSTYQEDDATLPIEENDATAKALFEKALKELKIKQLKVTLTHEATDEFSRVATLVKSYLEQKLDISVHLEPMPFKEFCQVLPQGDFEMSLFCSYSQYSDVINFLERFETENSPRNFTGWTDTNYASLLKKYREAKDPEKRQDIAAKAEAILLKQMPIAPLYYHYLAYTQKPYVRNLLVSPIGIMQFDKVYLEKRAAVNPDSAQQERFSCSV